MKQWIAFWTLGLIWGSSFLLIKIAVEDLGTLPLVSLRIGIAAALMMLYLIMAGYKMPTARQDILNIIFVGIFNLAVPFSLITRAEESIDSSLATILNSTVPLFSLIIAHFALTDEKLNRYKILGLLIGYGGVMVLTSRSLNGVGDSPVSGIAMMLGATASYAVAVVFMRARLRHITPIIIAGTSLLVAAIVIIPLTLIVGNLPKIDSIGTDAIIAISILSTVNTVIAYFLFYHLIGEWGARATMVTYTFPPIGIVLGAAFLDEPVDARLILGAAFVLAGIFAVNYKGRMPRGVTVAITPPQPSTTQ